MKLLPLALFSSALLAACAGQSYTSSLSAPLLARSGSNVAGDVSFYEMAGGVRVVARASGLTPGEHGFHIHEVGDCSAPDAASAKGHYNPMARAHGHHSGEHHQGDMPNLIANERGEARLEAELRGVTLAEIKGRAVVVHADPDDYKSQPAGNSGKRVACGVIAR